MYMSVKEKAGGVTTPNCGWTLCGLPDQDVFMRMS